MRISEISFKQISGAAALVCVALLAYAYYLQYAEGQDPCPLCLVQRGFYYGLLIVFALGALHAPAKRGARLAYAIGAFMLALGGAATGARQVWLQHLPADQVPACGPDLFFMMENLPLGRMLQLLLRGSGQCAEVHWTFFGLSIAEWSLAWFVAFGALALWLALRRQ